MTGSDVQQSFRDSQQHFIADENVIRMNIANSVSEIGEIPPRAELAASANGVPWGARAESRTIRWWLWWNVLSVDAPIVAVVWAALFAHASGGKLSAA
jgi:hypothetical protein